MGLKHTPPPGSQAQPQETPFHETPKMDSVRVKRTPVKGQVTPGIQQQKQDSDNIIGQTPGLDGETRNNSDTFDLGWGDNRNDEATGGQDNFLDDGRLFGGGSF